MTDERRKLIQEFLLNQEESIRKTLESNIAGLNDAYKFRTNYCEIVNILNDIEQVVIIKEAD